MSNPSYQSGPGAPYQPYGAQQPPLMSPSPRQSRSGAIAAAVFVLLAGVAGGIVMLLLADNRHDKAVEDLARAPIGCATTLDFADTGTFVLFVETKGEVGDLDGDCPNANRSYVYAGANAPDVDIILTDSSGTEVGVSRDRSKSYERGIYAGESVGTVTISAPGEYVLTASSAEAEVVVAVGKDPADAVGSLRVGGFIAIGAGVVVGLLMLVLAMRRGNGQPMAPAAPAAAPAARAAGMPGYDVYTPSAPAAPMPPVQMPPVQAPPVQPPTVQQPTVPPSPFAPPTEVLPSQPPQGGQWPAPPTN
jgi:hypothetical protein